MQRPKQIKIKIEIPIIIQIEKCSDSSASLELAHGGSVWAIAAQGNLVVAGATGGLLALWDIRKGLSSLPLASAHDAHSDAIAGLQFIADGRTLVSSSFDSTVRLWDVPRLLADATPLGGSVSPTGTMLRGLRATIPVGNLSRCTRVVADDTRIIVGCIGRHLAIIDMAESESSAQSESQEKAESLRAFPRLRARLHSSCDPPAGASARKSSPAAQRHAPPDRRESHSGRPHSRGRRGQARSSAPGAPLWHT
ncbi:hypothetical protein T492DRAFT_942534 [Pavlovales sp. CCMP2436]|nr:hypothetical protein T492DRAFT_942534 [Pavlovales sp. CCMP2436]